MAVFFFSLLLLTILPPPSLQDRIPLANLQPDGRAATTSFLSPVDNAFLDIYNSFSFCVWFRVSFINGPSDTISSILDIAAKEKTDVLSFSMKGYS